MTKTPKNSEKGSCMSLLIRAHTACSASVRTCSAVEYSGLKRWFSLCSTAGSFEFTWVTFTGRTFVVVWYDVCRALSLGSKVRISGSIVKVYERDGIH